MAWRLGRHQAHLIVMWSIPYNLNIFNSYFAVGVASLSSRFRWLRCLTCRYQPPASNFYIYSKDMLPFWYREMIRKWTINVNECRFFQSKSKNPPEKVWQLLMALCPVTVGSRASSSAGPRAARTLSSNTGTCSSSGCSSRATIRCSTSGIDFFQGTCM